MVEELDALKNVDQTKTKGYIVNATDVYGFGMKIDGINDTELLKDNKWQTILTKGYTKLH